MQEVSKERKKKKFESKFLGPRLGGAQHGVTKLLDRRLPMQSQIQGESGGMNVRKRIPQCSLGQIASPVPLYKQVYTSMTNLLE